MPEPIPKSIFEITLNQLDINQVDEKSFFDMEDPTFLNSGPENVITGISTRHLKDSPYYSVNPDAAYIFSKDIHRGFTLIGNLGEKICNPTMEQFDEFCRENQLHDALKQYIVDYAHQGELPGVLHLFIYFWMLKIGLRIQLQQSKMTKTFKALQDNYRRYIVIEVQGKNIELSFNFYLATAICALRQLLPELPMQFLAKLSLSLDENNLVTVLPKFQIRFFHRDDVLIFFKHTMAYLNDKLQKNQKIYIFELQIINQLNLYYPGDPYLKGKNITEYTTEQFTSSIPPYLFAEIPPISSPKLPRTFSYESLIAALLKKHQKLFATILEKEPLLFNALLPQMLPKLIAAMSLCDEGHKNAITRIPYLRYETDSIKDRHFIVNNRGWFSSMRPVTSFYRNNAALVEVIIKKINDQNAVQEQDTVSTPVGSGVP